MYRVIIADDEPWVIYGLEHIINWEAQDFTVCATASNGLEALEKCRELHPDVLLCDIRMPGVDGLELIRTLCEKMPEILVVFISGYSEFEYAQKALRHGAFDYLIKQVSAEQLTETLTRLKARLGQRVRQNTSDAYFALLDEDSTLNVEEWIARNGRQRNYARFRFLTFPVDGNDCPDLMTEQWSPELGSMILRTGRNKASALVGYSSHEEYENWARRFYEQKACCCGISCEENGAVLFAALYSQADIAYCTAKITRSATPVRYRKERSSEFDSRLAELMQATEEALKSQDDKLCSRLLGQIGETCSELMLDRVTEIYNSLVHLFRRYRLSGADAFEIYSYRRLALEFVSITDIFQFFRQSLDAGENPAEFSVQRILQYIDEHYTEELRVSELADMYHFSPSYFSTLFKKSVGMALSRYITMKRINLAKRLLSETDISIQEVVERTGYNDYFHFIRVFRREVGITPGHFRNTGHPGTNGRKNSCC